MFATVKNVIKDSPQSNENIVTETQIIVKVNSKHFSNDKSLDENTVGSIRVNTDEIYTSRFHEPLSLVCRHYITGYRCLVLFYVFSSLR